MTFWNYAKMTPDEIVTYLEKSITVATQDFESLEVEAAVTELRKGLAAANVQAVR